MTTRAERLAQQEARARATLAVHQRRLARVHAQQQADAQKALAKRRATVGKLAEDAGLFVLDDTTLAALFQALRPVCDTPNPAALVEELLCTVGSSPGRPVDGMAHRGDGVATSCPVSLGA